jgi:hypothetical protein
MRDMRDMTDMTPTNDWNAEELRGGRTSPTV